MLHAYHSLDIVTKVQKNVNSKIAQLIAWSLKCAADGTAPDRGFHGEEFPKSSDRAQLAGKELAQGWKCLASNH